MLMCMCTLGSGAVCLDTASRQLVQVCLHAVSKFKILLCAVSECVTVLHVADVEPSLFGKHPADLLLYHIKTFRCYLSPMPCHHSVMLDCYKHLVSVSRLSLNHNGQAVLGAVVKTECNYCS